MLMQRDISPGTAALNQRGHKKGVSPWTDVPWKEA